MKQQPSWEGTGPVASWEIPHILRNWKVHYCVRKNLLLVAVLGQINPVFPLPSYFFKIHFDIVLPYMPSSFLWSLLFRCLHHNSVCASSLLSSVCGRIVPHLCNTDVKRVEISTTMVPAHSHSTFLKCRNNYFLICESHSFFEGRNAAHADFKT